jgi:GT2 family glycosyltransferase
MPSVVALIPTHHRFDLLSEALDSLGSLPVLIVDDSAEGDLPERLSSRAREVIRSRGEEGFSRAVNLGLTRAEALGVEWVLLVNDDAVLEPGAVDALLAARAEGVGLLAPILVHPDGSQTAGVHLRPWGRVSARRNPQVSGDPRAVSGACVLLRSRERMDPSFRHGMEDFELCQRVRARGERIQIVAAARCKHLGGGSIPMRSRTAQRHGVSGHLRLYGGGWRSPVVLGLALGQVIRERGPASRLLGIWDGWWDWRNRDQPPLDASVRL